MDRAGSHAGCSCWHSTRGERRETNLDSIGLRQASNWLLTFNTYFQCDFYKLPLKQWFQLIHWISCLLVWKECEVNHFCSFGQQYSVDKKSNFCGTVTLMPLYHRYVRCVLAENPLQLFLTVFCPAFHRGKLHIKMLILCSQRKTYCLSFCWGFFPQKT